MIYEILSIYNQIIKSGLYLEPLLAIFLRKHLESVFFSEITLYISLRYIHTNCENAKLFHEYISPIYNFSFPKAVS